MIKYYFICFLLALVIPFNVFAQTGAGAVRDYVGLLNQSYHPDIVSYFERSREEMSRRGETGVVQAIDIILGGGFGSGFLYRHAANGNFYVLTNNHVISQAYNVSITFERVDGTRTRIDNLTIIATDVDNDLALLALPAGASPLVNQGLVFLTRQIEEGEEVFSAGFPGLGLTPLWQFGGGRVSNAAARFPRSLDDPTLMGPFVQHTAPIDPGNSGGPLLVAQANAPSGFAVVGINSSTGIFRQATNFAIPASTVQAFINEALNPRPETFRAALDERLSDFVGGLEVNRAVFPHIAEFLSARCVGENAEFAFEEMFDRAPRTVVRTFIERGREDFIAAMGIAVAWTIEDSIRTGAGALRASISEVTGEGEEYTVVFTINNRDVSSVWIREYGNWRIGTFGTIAAGDRALIDRRQAQRERDANLRLNSDFHIEAGYANLFDSAALFLNLGIGAHGFNFYYSGDILSIGAYFGFRRSIRAGALGFIPYFRLGLAYIRDEGSLRSDEDAPINFYLPLLAKAGIKITSSHVPGLFLNTGFQYNYSIFNLFSERRFTMALTFSVGYAF